MLWDFKRLYGKYVERKIFMEDKYLTVNNHSILNLTHDRLELRRTLKEIY